MDSDVEIVTTELLDKVESGGSTTLILLLLLLQTCGQAADNVIAANSTNSGVACPCYVHTAIHVRQLKALYCICQ